MAWLRTRFARCYACGRLLALHGPRRLARCERTPLAIAMADQEEVKRTAR